MRTIPLVLVALLLGGCIHGNSYFRARATADGGLDLLILSDGIMVTEDEDIDKLFRLHEARQKLIPLPVQPFYDGDGNPTLQGVALYRKWSGAWIPIGLDAGLADEVLKDPANELNRNPHPLAKAFVTLLDAAEIHPGHFYAEGDELKYHHRVILPGRQLEALVSTVDDLLVQEARKNIPAGNDQELPERKATYEQLVVDLIRFYVYATDPNRTKTTPEPQYAALKGGLGCLHRATLAKVRDWLRTTDDILVLRDGVLSATIPMAAEDIEGLLLVKRELEDFVQLFEQGERDDFSRTKARNILNLVVAARFEKVDDGLLKISLPLAEVLTAGSFVARSHQFSPAPAGKIGPAMIIERLDAKGLTVKRQTTDEIIRAWEKQ